MKGGSEAALFVAFYSGVRMKQECCG